TNLPYLVALAETPPGTHFRGAILDAVDYQSHLTRMRPGLQGSWLYQLAFTAEPHQPLLVQTFYVTLGHIARWTGLALDPIYALARIILTACLVWAVWIFMNRFLPARAAWWALLLALFGGGIGYLLLLIPGLALPASPLEFWLLDGYIYLAAFA